jgi:magnesium chelatase subunit I
MHERLKNVTLDYDFRVKISQICSELDVDGLRGDIWQTEQPKL